MKIGKIIRVIRNVPKPIPVHIPKPAPIPAPSIFKPKPVLTPRIQ